MNNKNAHGYPEHIKSAHWHAASLLSLNKGNYLLNNYIRNFTNTKQDPKGRVK